MQSFLDKVAAQICEKHANQLTEICIVLPNKRAGLFLKKLIPLKTEKTTWSPDIFSIEDFCIQLSGYKLADPISLLFDFYEIHKHIEGEKAQPFDEFIQWGQIILNDIDEIDMSMADAKSLFSYLSEAKAIEKWNPGQKQLTRGVKNYLRFYRSLYDYYKLLRAQAEAKKTVYKGLIFRNLAEKAEVIVKNLRWEKVYFAGFNALTKSELTIATAMVTGGKAEMIWDADDYYLSDFNQEAGIFLRRQIEKFGQNTSIRVNSGFKEIIKDIVVCGTPKNLGQARYAASIIQKWAKNSTARELLSKTALVLADENLLFQVLDSLDSNLPTFNVTMGLPLKYTSAFQFFSQILRLYENVERFLAVTSKQSGGFYYTDLVKLLQHPYMQHSAEIRELLGKIRKGNIVFYQPEQLKKLITDFSETQKVVWDKIFNSVNPKPNQILENMIFLIHHFRKMFSDENFGGNDANKTELEFLFYFSKIILRLKGFLEKYSSIERIKTLRKLLDHLAQNTRIPFEGEPLAGLQIMGLLETRTLDFDQVILLSANEGILPSGHTAHSFIPPDIKQDFGIPVYQEKNAVFAYHFYHLLQNAREVHLVYNTEPDELGGGEPSRFIQQLLIELPRYQPLHQIRQTIASLPVQHICLPEPIVVPKTEDVYKKLMDKGKSGFSPSSINNYRSCPLSFYFQEIAGIAEAEEVEETMEYITIGNIVHKALEILYSPYLNQILRDEHLAKMQLNASQAIIAAINEKYPDGDISFGWNKLKTEVITNFVRSFLSVEKDQIRKSSAENKFITLLNLEKRYESFVTLLNSENTEIKIKGFIDRVDQLDGVIRIIDYKTGDVKPAELKFSSWDNFIESDNNGKAFQVMIYAWLYQNNHPENRLNFTSGIFSLRRPGEGLMNFTLKQPENENGGILTDYQLLENFEDFLKKTLTEIFDRQTPFTQTTNIELCRRCSFKGICAR